MPESYHLDTKLKVLRVSRDWSQEYIAEKLGISQAAYAKLETGETRLTVDRAGQLAGIYEIDPEYFFTTDRVINYNSGSNSHGGLFNTATYNNGVALEMIEKLMSERNEVARILEEELAASRKERAEIALLLQKLIEKL
jgi:transcriptional regulator with XRE-family HTH domain